MGELVLAVGNPWGREGAVTVGVVEARAPADPDLELEPAEEDERPQTNGRSAIRAAHGGSGGHGVSR